eukprot:TRINITY_DN24984_c0_g1_i2.p1 TRINITY_DN24984_c0_g1~~TRINITY_DN24984_c0_g1_i2.p1  ORF type:complete len:188 (-),score=53.80 TRINITY_DN24984_c0_g1_i2:37-600(-)
MSKSSERRKSLSEPESSSSEDEKHHKSNRDKSTPYRRSNSKEKVEQKQDETTTIKVELLSPNILETHLKEIFGTYGKVLKIDLPRNGSGIAKDYSYIEFATGEDAEMAAKFMDNGEIDGMRIRVDLCRRQKAERRVKKSESSKRPRRRSRKRESRRRNAKRSRSRSRRRSRTPVSYTHLTLPTICSV